jgi:cytidylate kinase
MPIVSISRGSLRGGQELAERLAQKLGCECISRENVSDVAVRKGIPVGRMQTAMVKPPRVRLRMGPERDAYVACITAHLCEHSRRGSLVYHGYASHLLLPGVSHVFRVRVVADLEYRIRTVEARLNLNREKAKEYVRQVDEDRAKWARFLHGVDWDDPILYDVIVNLETMGIDNAATAMCEMAQLPPFRPTPASVQALENLWLASRARLALATDRRTAHAEMQVRADRGVVFVTYLPQQAEVCPLVPQVLKGLEGCQEVHCTIATTRILWVQESYDPTDDVFGHVLTLARRWDAGVELLRYVGTEKPVLTDGQSATDAEQSPVAAPALEAFDARTGGIEDDTGPKPGEVRGFTDTMDDLQKVGRLAGGQTFHGPPDRLLSAIGRGPRYSAIVVGSIYDSKPPEVRARLVDELVGLLGDHLESPVVPSHMLRARVQIGFGLILRLVAMLAVTTLFFWLIFTHQDWVLGWLTGTGQSDAGALRFLRVASVAAFIPVVAYLYGMSVRLILRFLRVE